MFTHHTFTVHTLGLGTRLQTSQAHLDHAFPSFLLEFSKGVNKTFEILFFFPCRVKSIFELLVRPTVAQNWRLFVSSTFSPSAK